MSCCKCGRATSVRIILLTSSHTVLASERGHIRVSWRRDIDLNTVVSIFYEFCTIIVSQSILSWIIRHAILSASRLSSRKGSRGTVVEPNIIFYGDVRPRRPRHAVIDPLKGHISQRVASLLTGSNAQIFDACPHPLHRENNSELSIQMRHWLHSIF